MNPERKAPITSAGADVVERLSAALDEVEGLPPTDTEGISVLIRAGEWALALDTLCTQIHEFDLALPRALRNELLQLGVALQTPAGYLLGDPWEARPSTGPTGDQSSTSR